jgi:murein DD-endopeptidase MepM/ murein hydrolase activator NlpD
MRSKRYTIVVADRRTGVVRRFTLSLWPTLMTVSGVLALPVLIGTGAALKARYEVASIYTAASSLEIENNNYRIATEALSGQIQGLQAAITELGAKAALDPSLQSAMDKLPAVVKSRAMGGGSAAPAALGALPALQSPENTFGLLRELLQGIESRLSSVRVDLDKRNALAAATPSIWPAHGWLTSRVGTREDPITGERDFHPGLDISADHGSPVYATADGTVSQAEPQTGYGNLVIVDHGFGLESRYGHLSRYKVRNGEKVNRPLHGLAPPLRSAPQRPSPQSAPAPAELPALNLALLPGRRVTPRSRASSFSAHHPQPAACPPSPKAKAEVPYNCQISSR